MFQEIIERARTRQFHNLVDDRLLDHVAEGAGCASGIGRMSVLSDEDMAVIANAVQSALRSNVLDLGCGRGFAGRFLRQGGYTGRYVGVDRIVAALEAAQRNVPDGEFEEVDFRERRWECQFEAVLALEVTRSGQLDEPLVQGIASALRPGGSFAITIASTDGRMAARLDDTRILCERYFARVEITDTSAGSARFAKRFYRAILEIDEWEPFVKQSLHGEANRVLRAIDEGRFEYAVVTGVA
ncbi:MAG: class I SAM-dependent methyltransferase [Vulcanimicrobiaceae bacterium]